MKKVAPHHILLLVVCLWLLPSFGGRLWAHDVHISYCRGELSGTSFTGKMTYYIDDLGKAFAAWRNQNWLREWRRDVFSTWLDFLRDHFRVASDGNPAASMTIRRCGLDGSSFWYEFDLLPASPIHSLRLLHTMLFRQYNDQMNMLIVKTSQGETSRIFTPSDTTATLTP